jgi:hypothetical protein
VILGVIEAVIECASLAGHAEVCLVLCYQTFRWRERGQSLNCVVTNCFARIFTALMNALTQPPWSHANADALAYVQSHALAQPAWPLLHERILRLPEPPAFALDAVRTIQGFWPHYVEDCRAVLKRAVDNPFAFDDNAVAEHVYCGYLLAEHRDPGCFEIMQKLSSFDDATCEALLGADWGESVDRWLAAFCHHDAARREWLAAAALDQGRSYWMRLCAFNAVVRCVNSGSYSRQDAVQLGFDMLNSAVNDDPDVVTEASFPPLDPEEMAGLVMCHLLDLGPDADAVARLEPYFNAHQIDESILDWKCALASTPRTDLVLPACTVEELSHWAWFNESEHVSTATVQTSREISPLPWLGGNDAFEHTPFVRETEKVGRNDPCPCGSGKKFKKCCGA